MSEHTAENDAAQIEALANLIPLGFDRERDGVSNVYEAAERIFAAGFRRVTPPGSTTNQGEES